MYGFRSGYSPAVLFALFSRFRAGVSFATRPIDFGSLRCFFALIRSLPDAESARRLPFYLEGIFLLGVELVAS